jgi:two-component system, chemotaxis family, sensor kinase CheA
MLQLDVHVDLAGLTEQIDELSTRLILDGVATLASTEFEDLGRTAASLGQPRAESVAHRIADDISSASGSSVAELTRLVSSGLIELRRTLDELPSNSQIKPASDSIQHESESRSPASEPTRLAADEELIREFITEATEHLAAVESQLLILEQDNSAVETLNAIFRGFHTIKGLAGFLEFAEIQAVTHELETLLDLARAAELAMTPAIVDVVLESTDVLRQELAAISQRLAGQIPPPTSVNSALLDRIRQMASVATPAPAQASGANESSEVRASRAAPFPARSEPITSEPEPVPSQHLERRAGDASSVRIETAKLDQLMDLVGEMVIAQTLIRHDSVLESVKDARLQRNLTQLARITADVQRITTVIRMVPIGLQFNKTARVVRDLARRTGKQIVFEATGEDTELDKTIAEELSDPLLHMVRNSIDHGIESAEERIALGKNPTAHIRVAAYHQSGQIVVVISDDGRGLNREKILAKARQNGLIHHSAQLADNEMFLLIFEAGFSTADKVTDISGRGVGMDVVRRHVQKLRGRIEVQSKEGEGATFFIKLPLTLAIIEGLVVAVGQQRYIVPIFAVREMFRPTQEMLSTVHGKGEMVMIRGGLLPIVRLHRRFGIEPRSINLTEGALIVAESEGRAFCLFVDDLIGKQEVVIKSLGHRFKHVAELAGCAILGDGHVGLILDMDGIVRGRT